MTDEYKKLDKTFNITPEVVKEEPKSIERVNPPPDRLTKMKLLEIMSILEVIFIV